MKKLIATLIAGVFAAMAFNTFAADEAKPAATPPAAKKHHKKAHAPAEKKEAPAAGTEKK
jgi:hypothetical protein